LLTHKKKATAAVAVRYGLRNGRMRKFDFRIDILILPCGKIKISIRKSIGIECSANHNEKRAKPKKTFFHKI